MATMSLGRASHSPPGENKRQQTDNRHEAEGADYGPRQQRADVQDRASAPTRLPSPVQCREPLGEDNSQTQRHQTSERDTQHFLHARECKSSTHARPSTGIAPSACATPCTDLGSFLTQRH
jgi:hypothetical protein